MSEIGEKINVSHDGTDSSNQLKERVVISGISGVFPQCDNLLELQDKIFTKTNLITDLEDGKFSVGKLNAVNKFDATFFNISNEHADYMDPMCRILLEKTYESIVDAGYNPSELKDSNTAVYVGNCTSDAEVESIYRTDIRGALICERAQSFLANRISYWLGCHGTSCVLNTACSASFYALYFAYKSIARGECDTAIVGGSNLCLSPQMLAIYTNLGITSSRCRSFDDNANGFCRSEAIGVIVLQNAKIARRIYAEVVNINVNSDGYKERSILFPSHIVQSKLMKDLYEECNVPTKLVSWVEAHGTGTRVGDYQEMRSLDSLCNDRTSPLLVGCVKSNIGHTEAASGICSISKVIIAMETGLIPPNINFEKPQSGIESLRNNRIKVITDLTPWNGGYVAINNFGIGGANAHLLLKSHNKERNSKPTMIPYIINVSGRTEEAVDHIFSFIKSHPVNTDLIGLFHKIHSTEIQYHEFRGYTIVTPESNTVTKNIKKIHGRTRPIWFIYPGIGSQWASMAKELMHIPRFCKSIKACQKVLEIFDVNLIEIVTSDGDDIFQNITNCFVGITSVMISLTDLLLSVGIKPDGLIGHSFGEICCAYADGCLSLKEAVLVAYYRGRASEEAPTEKCLMAVIGSSRRTVFICSMERSQEGGSVKILEEYKDKVGFGFEGMECLSNKKLLDRRSPSIEIVCCNGKDNITVAGPLYEVKTLLNELKCENIFVHEIFSSHIAYHSSYITQIGIKYKQYLGKILCQPKQRSSKWITTSIKDITTEPVDICLAKYFVNNLLNPVLFEDALKSIPVDAITIEIAPHAILKNILNSTLDECILNIPFLNKNCQNISVQALQVFGILYENNINMDLSNLYEPIQFPVCRQTPMIAPLVKWNHAKNWYVPYQSGIETSSSIHPTGKSIAISLKTDEFRFLENYQINDQNVIPDSEYLKLVLNAFLKLKPGMLDGRVIFRNVVFRKSVQICPQGPIVLEISLQKHSGRFEVVVENEIVCEGILSLSFDEIGSVRKTDASVMPVDHQMNEHDIYYELRIRGYNYKNCFQNIISCNFDANDGFVKLSPNLTVFLDSLLQLMYLKNTENERITLISEIAKIDIDMKSFVNDSSDTKDRTVRVKVVGNSIYCKYTNIKWITTKQIRKTASKEPILQTFKFFSYLHEKELLLDDILKIIITIVIENTQSFKLNVYEFVDQENRTPALTTKIANIFKNIPLYKVNIVWNVNMLQKDEKFITELKIENNVSLFHEKLHLVIMSDVLNHEEEFVSSCRNVIHGGFVLSRETLFQTKFCSVDGMKLCATYITSNEKFVLWHKITQTDTPLIFKMNEYSFEWIKQLQDVIHENPYRRIVLFSDAWCSGLLGFYNCIRKEIIGQKIRCVLFLKSNICFSTSTNENVFEQQLKQDLATNVFKSGTWGLYVPIIKDFSVYSISSHFSLQIETDEIGSKYVCVPGNLYSERYTRNSKISDNLIHVYYASLVEDSDSKSILVEKRSFEFSGVTSSGTRVVGISHQQLISNLLTCYENYYCNVPVTYSLEEAITIPYAYLTILLALEHKTVGENTAVLIQNNLNSVCQALMYFLLNHGCTVYTLEDNEEHLKFTSTHFSKVHKSFCTNGCLTIEELFLQEIDGGKIDMFFFTDFVETTEEILITLPEFCRTIHLTCNGSSISNRLLEHRRAEIVCLNSVLTKEPDTVNRLLSVLEEKMATKSIKPLQKLKIGIKDVNKIKNEPRHEKLILEILPEDDSQSDIRPKIIPQKTKASFLCSSKSTYIIYGGLGGMGFELAKWLVSRGANNLVLVSRTGNCDGYRTKYISRWQSVGVRVIISTSNILDIDEVKVLLEDSNRLGDVAAIFNTALVLEDAAFRNQTLPKFQAVTDPKAKATFNLHVASKIMCPRLQYFVVFSSVSCGFGNAGQTSYGYANSVMERICEQRRSEGLPACAVEWGGVNEVGYLEKMNVDTDSTGTLRQSISSCLETLDKFLCSNECIMASYVVAEKQIADDTLIRYSLFTSLNKIIGGIDMKLKENSTLSELGLDSIAITETKHILENKYDTFYSTKQIYDLKIKDLLNIEKNHKKIKSVVKSADAYSVLNNVYSNLARILSCENDLRHLSPITKLHSLLPSGDFEEKLVPEERTIFFFPSVEGFSKVMVPLSKNIDIQVLCLQYDITATSVEEIRDALLPYIKSRLKENQRFEILGYSYGGLIAMEIAHILEQEGKLGYLYLIDSSPDIVKLIGNILFGDNMLKINATAFVTALYPEVDLKKFQNDLHLSMNWNEMCNFAVSSLPSHISLDKDNLLTILDTLYKRSQAINLYNGPKTKIKSKVFFMKPKNVILDIPSEHGLSKFCSTVEEYEIEGNHFTVLQSTKLAYYIMYMHKLHPY